MNDVVNDSNIEKPAVFIEKIKLIYRQLELSEKFQEEVGVINDDLRKLIDQSE